MGGPDLNLTCSLEDISLAGVLDQASLVGDETGEIGSEIEVLAEAGVPVETFYQEDGQDPFASLCSSSPAGLDLFQDYQQDLGMRVGEMTTDQIVGRLQELYDQAYAYLTTRTMDVVDETAKRELDLWIAVIGHQAYDDPEFLARVNIPRIQYLIGLASPHLSPEDRAYFYQDLSTEVQEENIDGRDSRILFWPIEQDRTYSFVYGHFQSLPICEYVLIRLYHTTIDSLDAVIMEFATANLAYARRIPGLANRILSRASETLRDIITDQNNTEVQRRCAIRGAVAIALAPEMQGWDARLEALQSLRSVLSTCRSEDNSVGSLARDYYLRLSDCISELDGSSSCTSVAYFQGRCD